MDAKKSLPSSTKWSNATDKLMMSMSWRSRTKQNYRKRERERSRKGEGGFEGGGERLDQGQEERK